MEILRAEKSHINDISKLLNQVLEVHHEGRPDIFRSGKEGFRKYSDDELIEILENDETPVFVAIDDDKVKGYAFCKFENVEESNSLNDLKSLYIDDLCVDENYRREHIGTKLLNFVKDFAKENGCYHITLNVWAFNEPARKFYENNGLKPLKIGMEYVI